MRIPIDEVVYFDVVTHNPSTGAVSDADSTPTFEVFEESTDTDIGVGGNLTKRTSKTGNYRGSFTASAANGFEVGKWYSIVASATVNAVAGKTVAGHFMIVPAENSAGKALVDARDLLTLQMTESYAADGAAPTLAQALHMLMSFLFEKSISSTTMTCKKLDGSTTSMTFTLGDASNPTTITKSG